MQRFVLALLALLLSSAAVGAVATVKTTLSTTAWTDLGVGPALVAPTGAVVFAIGDVTPTIPVNQGFMFPANSSQCLNTTSHVWAMSANAFAAFVFVAPIVGC
jgi:hypothetical protein